MWNVQYASRSRRRISLYGKQLHEIAARL